jgi:thiol-disulfide isomerase/thioredoxin
MSIFLLFFSLLLPYDQPTGQAAKASIQGVLLDSLGQPVSQGHVEWLANPRAGEAESSFPLQEQGRFVVQVPKASYGALRFGAPNHQSTIVPLYWVDGDASSWSIQLAPLAIKGRPETLQSGTLQVIGEFNGFDFASGKALVKQADGTFGATIPWNKPTLRYQVLGLVDDRSINGTQPGAYHYDGGGDYISEIEVVAGQARITVDLAKYPAVRPAVLNLEPQNSLSIQLTRVFLTQMARIDAYMAERRIRDQEEEVKLDEEPWIKALSQLYEKAQGEGKAMVGLACYTRTMPKAWRHANAPIIREQLPLQSPHWVLLNGIHCFLQDMEKLEPGFAEDYLQQGVVPSLKANIWQKRFYAASTAKDEGEQRRIYQLLKSEYGDQRGMAYFLTQNNPDRAIGVGKAVPEFEEALLGAEGSISRTSMLGKIYLIDFWATWCQPCVGELPHLHEAYERYRAKGLEILSFSFDDAAETVVAFRGRKFKMPWHHVFVKGGFRSDLAKRFEVQAIPKIMLIGADGTIVKTEEELRGPMLLSTLDAIFADIPDGAEGGKQP